MSGCWCSRARIASSSIAARPTFTCGGVRNQYKTMERSCPRRRAVCTRNVLSYPRRSRVNFRCGTSSRTQRRFAVGALASRRLPRWAALARFAAAFGAGRVGLHAGSAAALAGFLTGGAEVFVVAAVARAAARRLAGRFDRGDLTRARVGGVGVGRGAAAERGGSGAL